jgi:hypothetical protein
MSDIYLQITETPTVVTLSAPVVSGALAATVTVANVVSVNVVTMPAITVQAAAPSVTTVAGTVTIGSCVTHGVNVANSVTISSLPGISGTVTANCRSDIYDGINHVYYNKSIIAWGNPFLGEPTLVEQSTPLPISGTVTANVPNLVKEDVDSSGFYGVPAMGKNPDNDTYKILKIDQDGILAISGTVTANVFGINQNGDALAQIRVGTDGQAISSGGGRIFAEIVTRDGDSCIDRVSESVKVSGTVTIGNSVTIGSLPVQLSTTTIGGTARLNVTLSSATTIGATVPSYGNLYGGSDGTNLRAISVDTSGRTVVTGSVSVANTVPVSGTFWQATQPVSGTVTANIASTTVTISAQPSGALTTRFGSVTTANTAQITTAVTNTSRKYLLAQNISTATVTIGIGFSPTTTQGIQLTAGAGLTFDSFVPTGAVWWLGATTGATWTILEG